MTVAVLARQDVLALGKRIEKALIQQVEFRQVQVPAVPGQGISLE